MMHPKTAYASYCPSHQRQKPISIPLSSSLTFALKTHFLTFHALHIKEYLTCFTRCSSHSLKLLSGPFPLAMTNSPSTNHTPHAQLTQHYSQFGSIPFHPSKQKCHYNLFTSISTSQLSITTHLLGQVRHQPPLSRFSGKTGHSFPKSSPLFLSSLSLQERANQLLSESFPSCRYR